MRKLYHHWSGDKSSVGERKSELEQKSLRTACSQQIQQMGQDGGNRGESEAILNSGFSAQKHARWSRRIVSHPSHSRSQLPGPQPATRAPFGVWPFSSSHELCPLLTSECGCRVWMTPRTPSGGETAVLSEVQRNGHFTSALSQYHFEPFLSATARSTHVSSRSRLAVT